VKVPEASIDALCLEGPVLEPNRYDKCTYQGLFNYTGAAYSNYWSSLAF